MNFCATRYASRYVEGSATETDIISTGPIVLHALWVHADNFSEENIVTFYEGDGTTTLFRVNVYTLGCMGNPFEGPVLLDKGLVVEADHGIIWSVAYSDSGS